MNAVATHALHTVNSGSSGSGSGSSSSGSRICGNTSLTAGRCFYGRIAISSTAHQTTCAAGHTYWSCNTTAVAMHSAHTANSSSSSSSSDSDSSSSSGDSSSSSSGDSGESSNLVDCYKGYCDELVSTPLEHIVECPVEHRYWSCNPRHAAEHAGHTPLVPCARSGCDDLAL